MIDRAELDARIASVDAPAPHRPKHIRQLVDAILRRPVPGVLVECGAYQGISAAKLSHVAAALGTELVVFDSFRGLPEHAEPHRLRMDGRSLTGSLAPGAYAGSLVEVQANILRYGVPSVVRFVPGWLDETLPSFREPVAAAFLDVDLAASTRTCLRYLWPLVSPGGCIVSHDGHLPLTVAEMRRWVRWASPRPRVGGLGRRQVVVFRKPGRP